MSNNERNIILIGFRGTLKTTISKLLGNKLKRSVYSTDKIIEEQERKNISSIVEKNGWEYFRDVESKVLSETPGKKNIILDCGGGIILRKENCELIQNSNSFIVLLEANASDIERRISQDMNRVRFNPDISLHQEIESEIQKRKSFYHSVAQAIFNTSTLKKTEIVEMIARQFLQ